MVTTSRLTYQDYANMEGDELLDGELTLAASPNWNHWMVSLRLASRILSYARASQKPSLTRQTRSATVHPRTRGLDLWKT